MIDYIRGELVELTPTSAILETTGGVAYELGISLNTFSVLQGKEKHTEPVRLYCSEQIREDAWTLWGFHTKLERELFLLLTSVSGIGPGMARMALSAFSPAELCHVITSGDDKMLKQVKGIGPKAAQRIIVDLKDKVVTLGIDAQTTVTNNAGQEVNINSKVKDESIAALTMLGFSPAPTQKVVVKILTDDPDAVIETVIKKALKML
ncbi:MAG: Holliday junction branch migration protein RuvA [Bacteroidales bacterium]|nr:Holliday junction branch migration protein RuvA [Candidatus Physcousia equi]